jgi:hypothetical protein
MKVKDFVIKALREMGADGLYSDECDEPCGCGLDDMAPCGCDFSGCQPAKKDEDGLFWPLENET